MPEASWECSFVRDERRLGCFSERHVVDVDSKFFMHGGVMLGCCSAHRGAVKRCTHSCWAWHSLPTISSHWHLAPMTFSILSAHSAGGVSVTARTVQRESLCWLQCAFAACTPPLCAFHHSGWS